MCPPGTRVRKKRRHVGVPTLIQGNVANSATGDGFWLRQQVGMSRSGRGVPDLDSGVLAGGGECRLRNDRTAAGLLAEAVRGGGAPTATMQWLIQDSDPIDPDRVPRPHIPLSGPGRPLGTGSGHLLAVLVLTTPSVLVQPGALYTGGAAVRTRRAHGPDGICTRLQPSGRSRSRLRRLQCESGRRRVGERAPGPSRGRHAGN